MTKQIRSAFDQVYAPQQTTIPLVESRLLILLRHEPIEIGKLREAYFEIERRSKNVVVEVFNEFGIQQPKEKYIEIRNEKLVT